MQRAPRRASCAKWGSFVPLSRKLVGGRRHVKDHVQPAARAGHHVLVLDGATHPLVGGQVQRVEDVGARERDAEICPAPRARGRRVTGLHGSVVAPNGTGPLAHVRLHLPSTSAASIRPPLFQRQTNGKAGRIAATPQRLRGRDGIPNPQRLRGADSSPERRRTGGARSEPISCFGMGALRLYRWHIAATGADPRALRCHIVNAVIAPVLRNAAVLGSTSNYYFGKYSGPVEGEEVRLTLLARQSGKTLQATVEPHLITSRVNKRMGGRDDRICRADCAWYRRALQDVTDIALDLHLGADFAQHRAFVQSVPERAWSNHRGALALYLAQNSSAYRARCTNASATDEFWREFST